MLIYTFIHYTSFLIFLSLALFVLLKNRHSNLHRSLFFLMLSFSFWSFGMVFIDNPLTSRSLARFFVHFTSFSTCCYGIFSFLSISYFINKPKTKRWILLLFLIYFIGFSAYQLSSNFAYVYRKHEIGNWLIEYKSELGLFVLNVIHNGIVLIGFALLLLFFFKTRNLQKRKQARLILITGFLSYFLATVNVVLSNNLNHFYIPFMVDLFMLILASGFVYAVYRFELLEITPSFLANQIIEILPVGLIIANNSGNVIRINPALCKISQKKAVFFMNRDFTKIINALTGNQLDLSSVNDFNGQFCLNLPAKEQKAIYAISKPLENEGGDFRGVISIISDVDDLVKAERDLMKMNLMLEDKIKKRTHDLMIAKEKAEESDRLKTSFIHNISHEIRTPMNAIVGFSDLLKNSSLNEKRRDGFIEIITAASKQLLAIVNDILTISSIDTKQLRLAYSEFNLNQLMNELQVLAGNQQKKEKVSVVFENSNRNQEFMLTTDRVKLVQVMSNLLTNALKFTHEGSVRFGYSLSDQFIHFYVKDTGVGIEKEQVSKVFERFYQADFVKENNYGGTGLGLAISSEIVKLLGGEIGLESEPGVGSTFFFKLPFDSKNHDSNQTENNFVKN